MTLIIPKGSILDPSENAAVVGGNVLTSQRIVDVIFKAFGVCAASQVRFNLLLDVTHHNLLYLCIINLSTYNSQSHLLRGCSTILFSAKIDVRNDLHCVIAMIFC